MGQREQHALQSQNNGVQSQFHKQCNLKDGTAPSEASALPEAKTGPTMATPPALCAR